MVPHSGKKMMASTIEDIRRVFDNSGKDQAKGIGRTLSLE